MYDKHLPFHFDLDTDKENQRFEAEGAEDERTDAQQAEAAAESSEDDEGLEDEEDEDDLDKLLEGEDLGSEVAGTSAVKKV